MSSTTFTRPRTLLVAVFAGYATGAVVVAVGFLAPAYLGTYLLVVSVSSFRQ